MICPTCGSEKKDFPEHRCKCGVLIVGKTQKELDAAIKRHKCKEVKHERKQ